MPRWISLGQLVVLLATSCCQASLPDNEQQPPALWARNSSPYWQALVQNFREAEMAKRAPSDFSFFGMRGKKTPKNLNFFGMRGKKDDYEMSDDWYDTFDPALEKRAPAAGFFGMRGKKRPAGFFGMRGKKGPAVSNFFGVRGKKSDPEELDNLLQALLSKESPSYVGGEVASPYMDFEGGQMQKKAPSGFMGMRGKKDQGWSETITGSPARDVVEKADELGRVSD
ncbi:tachykinins isoform X2 [Neocloeon triangulifer]|nr:tachykinins isoform X2 [Neocloeon triangulifer]